MNRIFSDELAAGGVDRPNFLQRQFGPEQTRGQLVFDVVLGVIVPVLCFYFDPIVFKVGFGGPPILAPYQLVAYFISAIEVPVLAVWLIFGSDVSTSIPTHTDRFRCSAFDCFADPNQPASVS